MTLEWGPPRPPNCRHGLRAIGARVSGLTNHGTKSRERWGTRYLVGVYRGGVFRVLSQQRDAPRTPDAPLLVTRLCSTPAGGWRYLASNMEEEVAIGVYRNQNPGEITSLANSDDGVLVVTSTKPAQTRANLGRAWPGAVCVVRARYSRALIHRVERRMCKLLFREWRKVNGAKYGWMSGGCGFGENERGQPTTPIDVLIVTPQLRAVVRRQPPGLVEVDATLRPVHARA
jgi:hypothetical protein